MSRQTRALRKRAALGLAAVPFLGEKAVEIYLRRKYGPGVVTRTKARNFILSHRERLARTIRVRSRPWILNLDTFSGCNLKCPFCPTGTGQMDRRVARMAVDKAKRVIDRVKEHALEIRLYNWGEPFLNPHIFEIIRYAREAGLYTVINSNLSVTVPDLAQKIVESGLHRLQASVDGLTQETLEIYRRRANAELVYQNLKAISDERSRQGVDHPWISVAFLVFRHNEHELEQLPAKRREIGADEMWPRRAFVYHESFIPRHPDFQPVQAFFGDTCAFLYSELTVEANGAVSPCCTNTSERWDLGDIDEVGDIEEVWNGPTFRAMRAIFPEGEAGARRESEGKEILCEHCALVGVCESAPGKLTPLAPSLKAEGTTYKHGLPVLQPHVRD